MAFRYGYAGRYERSGIGMKDHVRVQGTTRGTGTCIWRLGTGTRYGSLGTGTDTALRYMYKVWEPRYGYGDRFEHTGTGMGMSN